MSQPFDLVIVGGGLGGATLAKCMAERGAFVEAGLQPSSSLNRSGLPLSLVGAAF